jgi:hypothetical protein
MKNSSASPSPDPIIDEVVKFLHCSVGCKDEVGAAVAACYPDSDDKALASLQPDVEACAKAGAALRNCMQRQFKAGVHETHIGNSN